MEKRTIDPVDPAHPRSSQGSGTSLRWIGVTLGLLLLTAPADAPAGESRRTVGEASPKARTAARETKVQQGKLGFRSPALAELAQRDWMFRDRLYRVESAKTLGESDVACGMLEAHVAKMETLWKQVVEEARGRPPVLQQLKLARPRFDRTRREVDEIVASSDVAHRSALAAALGARLIADDPRGPGYRKLRPTVLLLGGEPIPPTSRTRTVIREGSGPTAATSTVRRGR